MNPFDVIASVSHTKKRLIDYDNEKEYNAFLTNRGLSFYPDTIMYAQEMNQLAHLPGVMQYDYYFNALRPRKRWSKWHKNNDEKIIKVVMEYFDYSRVKALQALRILSPKDLETIAETMMRGRE